MRLRSRLLVVLVVACAVAWAVGLRAAIRFRTDAAPDAAAGRVEARARENAELAKLVPPLGRGPAPSVVTDQEGTSVPDLVVRARSRYVQRLYPAAASDLRLALRRAPGDPDAAELLGRIVEDFDHRARSALVRADLSLALDHLEAALLFLPELERLHVAHDAIARRAGRHVEGAAR
jgi:hypothetical protein